jgi:hypothetical protein
MSGYIAQWLEEYMLSEVGVVPAAEIDNRIGALREMLSGRLNPVKDRVRFEEVMTTAHFNYYFSDALSRAFYKDYNYQVGQWPNYIYADTAPDFRDVDRYRMTEPGGLQQRREKAEAKATHITDSEINYGVDEFSRQFDVSWRAIMNDDLGKIKETPQRMAKAANRWLDEFVSALYDNATTQAALNALGVTYGATGRLTSQNLAIGITAMMERQDTNGNRMNITGVNLVIPPILQLQAATILESVLVAGLATNDKNVIPRFIKGVYVDPYITYAAPNVPWYLFADKAEIPTVTLARMQGWPGPVVFKKKSDIELIAGTAPAAFMMGSFATGDIEYMVEDVVGGWDDASYVGVTDFHGIYYSAGSSA